MKLFPIAVLHILLTISLFFVNCSSAEKKPPQPNPDENKQAEDINKSGMNDRSTSAIDSKDDKSKSSNTMNNDLDSKNRSSSDKSTTEPVNTIDKIQIDPEMLFSEINEKLKDVRYPDGNTIEGFEYKKWEIPNRKDFEKWVKSNSNLIKDALVKLPEYIYLEVTGHADSTGPEEKEGAKLGNVFYSKKRAESVKSSLVKLGFPENRIKVNGVGSSQPIPGLETESPKNRRVTFQLINLGEKDGPSNTLIIDDDVDDTK
jgi:outer membrane protein OmpA-like peptidoglycan-associated protein